jgi:hypothetical protein
MGSHIMDIAWWALDLGIPSSCKCEGSEFHKDSVPTWITAEWEHPANDWRPGVKVYWYDGGKMPGMPSKAFNRDALKGNAAIFKGDKGYLVADFSSRYLMPTKGDMTHYTPPTQDELIPDVTSHHDEWINACKTDLKTRTNFDYSGTLIEQNLLSLVAYRVGKEIKWGPNSLSSPNCPEAEQFVKKTYRKGWVLNG